MDKDVYKTIDKVSTEALFKDRGSKFYGYAFPVTNEEEIKENIEFLKKQHYNARHWCYAWQLGMKYEKYRANDDGEPSNSAGAPILGQLQSFEFTNVFIGVVRYYGGTKLGVGGLINAYRTAAKEALLGARIVEREVFEWVRISFEYISMASVMNILKKDQLEMVDNIFELSCELKTNLPLYKADGIRDELKALKSVEIDSIGTY